MGRAVINNPNQNQKIIPMTNGKQAYQGSQSPVLQRMSVPKGVNVAQIMQGRGVVGQTNPESNIFTPQKTIPMQNAQELASANTFPLPPAITVQVTSATGSGAAAIRVYIFNAGTSGLNNVTNNGSGSDSVVTTYQDGFSGKVVNAILGNARNGVGAVCFGIAVRMTTTSTGAGNPAGLAISNPRFDAYTPLGSTIPTSFNITTDQTRGDFDNSIEVMPCIVNISEWTQFSAIIPVGNTMVVTFYFDQNFSR